MKFITFELKLCFVKFMGWLLHFWTKYLRLLGFRIQNKNLNPKDTPKDCLTQNKTIFHSTRAALLSKAFSSKQALDFFSFIRF